jgi:hypothetical protein
VLNDGMTFPKVNAALTITADAVHSSHEIIFLVPRNNEVLLIGGIAEPHENECKYSPSSASSSDRITISDSRSYHSKPHARKSDN